MPLAFPLRFPLTLGGGDDIHRIEHEALLDALAPGWDAQDPLTGSDTDHNAQAWAEATAISMIWAANKRLRNQAIPERMLEQLTVWEQSLSLRPTLNDTDVARRNRVAAKLRGIANNALGDIEEAARTILGINFEALLLVAPADWINYWPGVNPGPPGFEWSSNRAVVAIRMNQNSLGTNDFLALRNELARHLDAMLPSWQRFVVGVGTSFITNVGVVGQSFV